MLTATAPDGPSLAIPNSVAQASLRLDMQRTFIIASPSEGQRSRSPTNLILQQQKDTQIALYCLHVDRPCLNQYKWIAGSEKIKLGFLSGSRCRALGYVFLYAPKGKKEIVLAGN